MEREESQREIQNSMKLKNLKINIEIVSRGGMVYLCTKNYALLGRRTIKELKVPYSLQKT